MRTCVCTSGASLACCPGSRRIFIIGVNHRGASTTTSVHLAASTRGMAIPAAISFTTNRTLGRMGVTFSVTINAATSCAVAVPRRSSCICNSPGIAIGVGHSCA